MKLRRFVFAGLAGGVIVAAVGYATGVAIAWARYGHVATSARNDDRDPLLDRYMPVYDVVERHHVCVQAPADV